MNLNIIDFVNSLVDKVINTNGSKGDPYNYVYTNHFLVLHDIVRRLNRSNQIDNIVLDNSKRELKCTMDIDCDNVESIESDYNIRIVTEKDSSKKTVIIGKKSHRR